VPLWTPEVVRRFVLPQSQLWAHYMQLGFWLGLEFIPHTDLWKYCLGHSGGYLSAEPTTPLIDSHRNAGVTRCLNTAEPMRTRAVPYISRSHQPFIYSVSRT